MPPIKQKRRGRPPGTKNKKTKSKPVKDVEQFIKTERKITESVCLKCTRSFNTKASLKRHLKFCLKPLDISNIEKPLQPTFHCKKCSKQFSIKRNYIQHLRNNHSKLPGSVACKQCHVVCPNANVLARHIETIHQREIFECEHCSQKFVRQAHVIRHMQQKGCNGAKVSEFSCEICDAKFSRKDNLMVHIRLQHLGTKNYRCKLCDFHTKNFSKLIIHNQQKHTETQAFECDHCGKVTSSRGAMAKHLEIHGEKKYACDVCGYSTFTLEVMRRHVFTHVSEKPYKCEICDRSYIQKQQLLRHLERHCNNTCNICNKTFLSTAKLLVHQREHLGLTTMVCPYQDCEFSKKEFKNKTNLQDHLQSHVNDKMYACEVCPKSFNTEVHLRRHMNTHALERPRRCMYCVSARAYVRGEQLLRHVRKSHPKLFQERLMHVRKVLGSNLGTERVKKSELESILNVLDAESERIIDGYGTGVLYGGLQEQAVEVEQETEEEDSPLMSEEELAENLQKLLTQLIDHEMLECFGWPDESVDVVLEKVIENCGARAADREKWTRVQRLRENAKHLFLYVIEDKQIARMLDTHTIDQIVAHILAQVSKSDDEDDVKG